MAALTTGAPGIKGQSGTDRVELMLKQFGGEVIAEFDKAFKLRSKHRVKPLSPGRKADMFPVIGRASGKYHQPGDNILTESGYLQTLKQNERLIWADRPFVSTILLDNMEERLNYWPDRQEYAKQLAYSLSAQADQNVIRVLARAARAYVAAGYTGAPTGSYIVPGDVGGTTGTSFTAAQLVDAFAKARRKLEEKNIPESEKRMALITPATMELLINSSAGKDAIHRFYNDPNGSIAQGVVMKLHGFELIETNNMPEDNLSTRLQAIGGQTDYTGNDYRIDMRNVTDAAGSNQGSATRAICFTQGAVGSVVSAEIGIETEYKIELRGDLVVASYAMGHGELRPECVVEIGCNTKPSAPA